MTVTADTAFAEVVAACAAPRGDERRTWITPAMRRAYEALHAHGVAHSLEVWVDGELAGGIYGVAIGRAFFGESMFSRVTDGSKIAIVYLARAAGALGRAVHRLPGAERPPRLAGRARVAAAAIPAPGRRLVDLPASRARGGSTPTCPSGGGGRPPAGDTGTEVGPSALAARP